MGEKKDYLGQTRCPKLGEKSENSEALALLPSHTIFCINNFTAILSGNCLLIGTSIVNLPIIGLNVFFSVEKGS